jgi:hypothetical protein
MVRNTPFERHITFFGASTVVTETLTSAVSSLMSLASYAGHPVAVGMAPVKVNVMSLGVERL